MIGVSGVGMSGSGVSGVGMSGIRGSPKSLACCSCTLYILAIMFLILGLTLTILGFVTFKDKESFVAMRIMGPTFMGLFVMMLFLAMFTGRAANIQTQRWKAAEREGRDPAELDERAAYTTTNKSGRVVMRGKPKHMHTCGKAMNIIGIVCILAGIPLIIVGAVKGPSEMPWVFLIVWGPIICAVGFGLILGGWGCFKCAKIQEKRLKEREVTTAPNVNSSQLSTVSGQMGFTSAQNTNFGIPKTEMAETQYGGSYYWGKEGHM